MRRKMKRIFIAFLAIAIMLAIVPRMTALDVVADGTTGFLTGTEIDTIYGSALKGSDGKVYWENGFTALNFQADGTYTTKETKSFQLKELIGVDKTGNRTWLYCVEYNTGFSRTGYSGGSIVNNPYLMMHDSGVLVKGLNQLADKNNITGLDGEQSVRYILLTTIYGWQPNGTMPKELADKGLNDWDWYYGTQILIWEYQQGIRQSPNCCYGNGYNSSSALYNWIAGRPAAIAYAYVNEMMAQHEIIPSFTTGKGDGAVPTYTLKWNAETQRYEITMTDKNGYAFALQIKEPFYAEKNGNQYTIWTKKTVTAPLLCSLQKEITFQENSALMVWAKGGKQTMISGMQDPIAFYLRLQTEVPSITIQKTGANKEDISNRVFYVYKGLATEACLTITTDELGYAFANLPGEGQYRIAEQGADAYDVSYSVQNFTYPGSDFDKNNNITIHVNNARKMGKLQVYKDAEDGVRQGVHFVITGMGERYDAYTDANGYFSLDLKPGDYVVQEVNVPERYQQPEAFSVTIKAEETVIKRVQNKLKPARLKIIKQAEDDMVAGCQFRITGTSVTGNKVEQIVITTEDGTASVTLEQGDYQVSEINTSDKYYQPSAQHVLLQNGDETVLFFQNKLKPGFLQILKTSEDNIVEGMQFRVQGENGFAVTGYTDEDGYVVFGEKAYIVEVTSTYYRTNCAKYVVVDETATVEQMMDAIGLSVEDYYLAYASGTLSTGTLKEWIQPGEKVISTIRSYDSIGLDYPLYINARSDLGDNSEIYAQVIVRGHDTYSSKTPNGSDIQRAQNRIGQTIQMATDGISGYWVVLYDVDRDGVITQADIDIMQQSFDTKKPISGSRLLTVPAGTYQVTEINVPDRYVDNISLSVLVSGEETKIVRVHNVLNKGGIIIQKTAEDGVIANIQFRITNQITGEQFVVSTDENGRAIQRITAAGNYMIEELHVPQRYEPVGGQGVLFFKVPNAYETIQIHNVLKPGRLKIIKQSEDHVVSNISFRIQSIETTNGVIVDQVVTTDAAGEISLDLPQGTYVVTELYVPECYVSVEPQIIVLKAGEEAEIHFKNILKTPTLKIIKTAEDGVVKGVAFQVVGTTLYGEEYANLFVTDSNGEIFVNLPQGIYTIQELQEERYYSIEPQKVSLQNDAFVTVSFENILKTGTLCIEKESEAGDNTGIPFQIQGNGVDLIATTDQDGVLTVLLKPGIYTIRELFQDEKYIIPEAQQVTIAYDQMTIVQFQNRLKKFQLQLTKSDGSAQGGVVAGAIYGLYREDGMLIGQYTTDETGCFTTDAILCGPVYVQEIEAPKGYLLDVNQYWLNTSFEMCFLEVTPVFLEVTDYPITGNIRITKRMGTEDDWQYEPDAVFEVYLKSAGSYETAKEWERDLLVTDWALLPEENNLGEATGGGEAGSKELPLGVYVVHQVSGTEGYHLADDMEVILDENNRTVTLDILNVAGVEFPNTGGTGNRVFGIVGMLCLLIACSVACVIRFKNELVIH